MHIHCIDLYFGLSDIFYHIKHPKIYNWNASGWNQNQKIEKKNIS